MTIVYKIPEGSLLNQLSVINEVRVECGLTPHMIVLEDGRHIRFNLSELKALNKGDITDAEYITHNLNLGY